jgi:hypothetical protein
LPSPSGFSSEVSGYVFNSVQGNHVIAQDENVGVTQYFVTAEESLKTLAAWRLRFVLMRWLGLRCASELNALRWQDVNWEKGIIYVQDIKRGHNGEDKAIRDPAILPEVLPFLQKAFEQAPEGSEFVLPRMAHKNYRKFFLKILKHAGITPWPKLFNNLRASAITDALEWLPSHVVNEWFGNSEGISIEFYRMVTEDHYVKAVSRVSQIVTQQASATAESGGTEQNSELPITQKTQHGPQNTDHTGFTEWAMRDSNPRLPRCKRGALAN